MSKLNPLKHEDSRMDTSVRLAGGAGIVAAKQSNISLLRRATLANLLWENVAYMDGKSVSQEIQRLIPLCSPEEVASLAVEARRMQKLRHTPLFIAREMCKYPTYNKFVGDILPQIITRADMLSDFLALYWKEKKQPLTNQAKKGLAQSFHNFKEYHFAKYDRDAAIKIRDVMFMVHPNPKEGKEELFKKIAERTLQTPDTWEVALSTGKSKRETFTRLIQEGKLGGLAMLRNLRNMVDANVDHNVIMGGLKKLHSSMLMPLDYLKAAITVPILSRYIEDAMIEGYKNLPKLPGKTLFIVDVSGSMGNLNSSGSVFNNLDRACAMCMLAVNQCEQYDVVTTAGSDREGTHASMHIKYPEKGFGLFQQLVKNRLGNGGIFTRQCLDWCKTNVGDKYNRIIVFSDSQDCDRKNKVPNPFGTYNYICDVSANIRGINYKGVWTAEISGFSEHFLTFIAALEGVENKFEEE